MRCNEIDISVRLYEFDPSSILVNVKVKLEWLDIKIDDSKLDIDLNAKCRYCSQQIGFNNNIFEIYYCPNHGFLLNKQYIMYFANHSDDQDTNCVLVKSPVTEGTNQDECPYLKYNGKCSQSNCHYVHNPIQLKIWQFLNENEITLQLLACHQQKRKTGNLFKLNNQNIFDRNRVVHTIVNADNVVEFKDFIKYSSCDILQDYNQNGQSLLHVAVNNMDYDMIKLLLEDLFDCFALNDLAICEFYSFVNHKSNDP